MTMTKIETVTLGSAQAQIDFNSIPSTFTDLYLVASLRTTKADAVSEGLIKINGSSSSFSNLSLIGDGTTRYTANYSSSRQINSMNGANATSNTFSSHAVYFPNYAGSTNKVFSAEGATETNSGYMELGIMANLWSSTAAITSLSIYSSANLVAGCTATLYGILKGSGGATVS